MKPIRMAVIGCGGFFRGFHAPEFKIVPGIQCVAAVDSNLDNARKFVADSLPKSKVPLFEDHHKMLKEIKPDAVMVSTPHTLHFQHCYDAISAGAHVMVEKPMVTSSTDARKLVRHAKAKRRILQIAIQGTHTDTFAYARKLISDGTMGPLQLVTGILSQGWMKGTIGSWRQNPKLSGGGQLYDSSAHVLSAMMFLVRSPVAEVCCWTDNKGCKVDINAVAIIRFANGCMASITSGGNCPSWKSHLTFQGANARMEISPHGGDFLVTGGGLKNKKDITAVPKGWKIPSVSCMQNFADAIRGKAQPRCGGEIGILLADLMDALYASAATRKPVKVRARS